MKRESMGQPTLPEAQCTQTAAMSFHGFTPEDVEDRASSLWTAYHEAGHAVAYMRQGFDFHSVTIVREGDTLGMVHVPPRIIDGRLSGFIAAAGPIAEIILETEVQAEDRDEFDDWDLHQDISLAVYFAMRQGHGELHEAATLIRHEPPHPWWDMVVAQCIEDWPKTTLLARALLERKTMTYDACISVLEEWALAATAFSR